MPVHFLYTKQIASKKAHPIKIGDREYDSVMHACRVLSIGQDTIKKAAKVGFLKTGEPVTYLPRPRKNYKNELLKETTP